MAKAKIIIDRVDRIVQYYDDYDYYNYMVVEIIVGNKRFELGKNWEHRGFHEATRGFKKKKLGEIRRALGLSKKEFSKLMGRIGGYWSKDDGTYVLEI